tara:strand:- start:585 stop:1997 length:1413 start_codon:yes stop_codon:yes gene_type:complete
MALQVPAAFGLASRALPGSLVKAGIAATAVTDPKFLALGTMAGAPLLYDATDGFTQSPSFSNLLITNPEELGRFFAKERFSIEQALQEAQKNLKQTLVDNPKNYLELVKFGYLDEIDKLQNPPTPESVGERIMMPPLPPQQVPQPMEEMQIMQQPIQTMAEGGGMQMQGTPMPPDLSGQMQSQMPMDEVSQMEVQEAQEGLMQILQVIETLVQQGLSEDEIIALLEQYGITEAELEQAAQVLGIDMQQLLGGSQMQTPQEPMMMARGGPSANEIVTYTDPTVVDVPKPTEREKRIQEYLGYIANDVVDYRGNVLTETKTGRNIFKTEPVNIYLELLQKELGVDESSKLISEAIENQKRINSDAHYEYLLKLAEMGADGLTMDSPRVQDFILLRKLRGYESGGPANSQTPEEQIFSLNALINNLMTSYDMLVRNNEFERAQEVVDQIDKIQQEIIALQSYRVPMGLGQKKN